MNIIGLGCWHFEVNKQMKSVSKVYAETFEN